MGTVALGSPVVGIDVRLAAQICLLVLLAGLAVAAVILLVAIARRRDRT